MKIKSKRPKSDSVSPNGILSQSIAEELREMLSSEETCTNFVRYFAKAAAAELSDQKIGRVFELLMTTEAEHAVHLIFKHCESPIERIFFCCCINGFLKSHVIFKFMPPSDDFLKDAKHYEDFNTKLFRCYSFYKSLPDGARPKTFLRFLEITGIEQGELTQDDADRMSADACCLFDLSLMHVVRIVLQPTFPDFANGKTVRPDAVLWVPSNPEFKMILECDGFEYHGDKESFSRDRVRDRAFGNAGYSVRRYSGQEIHNQPVVASMDLINLVFEKDLHTLPSKKRWERAALKGQNPPDADLIESWRARMAEDLVNG